MAALKKLIPSRPFRLARDGEGSAAWGNATTNAIADRPLKSRDRRAAHGNGTAFSAVAPSSGPHSPPVDPITREWYCPQARIAARLTFQPIARFRPSGDSHQHSPRTAARLPHTGA